MIQLDFIQMEDYPADSCAISPTAFLFMFSISLCTLIRQCGNTSFILTEGGWTLIYVLFLDVGWYNSSETISVAVISWIYTGKSKFTVLQVVISFSFSLNSILLIGSDICFRKCPNFNGAIPVGGLPIPDAVIFPTYFDVKIKEQGPVRRGARQRHPYLDPLLLKYYVLYSKILIITKTKKQ